MRKRLKQQFAWISADTAQGFIDQLNHAGDCGYELYSTYKVQDRFMGALMMRMDEYDEANLPEPPSSAQILKLVREYDSRSSKTETPADEEGPPVSGNPGESRPALED